MGPTKNNYNMMVKMIYSQLLEINKIYTNMYSISVHLKTVVTNSSGLSKFGRELGSL